MSSKNPPKPQESIPPSNFEWNDTTNDILVKTYFKLSKLDTKLPEDLEPHLEKQFCEALHVLNCLASFKEQKNVKLVNRLRTIFDDKIVQNDRQLEIKKELIGNLSYHGLPSLVPHLGSHIYQISIFFIFLLDSKLINAKKYFFDTELEDHDTNKVEDIVCEYVNNRAIFLQSKQCTDTVKLKYSNLMVSNNKVNNDYSLKKLFKSFLKIKHEEVHIIDAQFLITNCDLPSRDRIVEFKDNFGNKIYFEQKQNVLSEYFEIGYFLHTSDDDCNQITKRALKKHFGVLDTEYTEQDLDEFMEKFILIPNYSQEKILDKLSKLLQKELDSAGLEFLKNQAASKMVDWALNLYTKKLLFNKFEKRHWDEKDFEKLFGRMRSTIEMLRKIGGNSLVGTENLEFEFLNLKLEFFIKSEKKKRILFVEAKEGETQFVRSKFYQSMKEKPKNNSITLQTSYAEEDLASYLEVFRTSVTHNICLFEIVSKSPEDVEKYDKLKYEIDDVMKNKTKKLIVVFEEGADVEVDATNLLKQEAMTLADITAQSFEWILKNSQVNLQGSGIQACKILNESIKNLIPKYSLKKLLDSPKIGDQISDPNGSLYVERSLIHNYELKPEIKEHFKSNITFDEREFNSWCRVDPKGEYHLLFEELDEYGRKTRKIWWKKSQGNLQKLKEYFKTPIPDYLSEIDEYTNRVTLIVEKAGNGKTTYFNHMAETLKEKFKDHFVINVCLNDHVDSLKTAHIINDLNSVVVFFVAMLNLKDDMEKILLINSLLETGKFIVLLDGADEAASLEYEENFVRLVQVILFNTTCPEILISTGPALKEKLGLCTKQFRQTLLPFTKPNQIQCITKYWTTAFDSFESSGHISNYPRQLPSEKQMKRKAKEIIKNLKVSDDEKAVIGVPLISRMLAEIFEDHAFDKTETILKEFNNILELYESFIAKKVQICCEKLGLDSSKKELIALEQEKIIALCTRYAIYSTDIFSLKQLGLIPEADRKQLTEEELEKIQKCGFFSGPLENLIFINRTFAEYFVALYLLKKFGRQGFNHHILLDVLCEPRFNVVRRFINHSPEIMEFGKQLTEDSNILTSRQLAHVLESAMEDHLQYLFASLTIPLMENEDYKLQIKTFISEKKRDMQRSRSRDNELENVKESGERDHLSLFVKYFKYSDDTNVQLFEKILEAYGTEFIRRFLDDSSLMPHCSGSNIPKILQWINANTSESDYEFVKNVLLKLNSDDDIFIGHLIKQFIFESEYSIGLVEQILVELEGLSSKYPKENLIGDIVNRTIPDPFVHGYVKDFNGVIVRLDQIFETVEKHMNSSKYIKFFKPFVNLEELGRILSESPTFDSLHSFINAIEDIFNCLDKIYKVTKTSSFKTLEKLAMKKLFEVIPNKVESDLFNGIRKLKIGFKNSLLYDFQIVKEDEQQKITFCDAKIAVGVFGSSYLMKNCWEMDVVDLIIEMIASEEHHDILEMFDELGRDLDERHLIFNNRELSEIFAKRLFESEKNLERIFFRDPKEGEYEYKLVIDLIFAAVKYGEPVETLKRILMDKRETCLRRIASKQERSLHSFLKIVKDRKLVGNFDKWLSKKNTDGKAILFYIERD